MGRAFEDDQDALTGDEFDHCMATLAAGRSLTLDDETRATWWEALKNVEGPLLHAAVKRMIVEDEGFPTLARVNRYCRDVARERLSKVSEPSPPAELSQDEYTRWIRGWRRAIVRGVDPAQAERLAVTAARGPATVRGAGNERGSIAM